jgi:hypothetical protein
MVGLRHGKRPKINVATLDVPHRRALEEVMGRELSANQQLLISVIESPELGSVRPAQSLEDWTHIYDGLSDEQIDAIDRIAKIRPMPAG